MNEVNTNTVQVLLQSMAKRCMGCRKNLYYSTKRCEAVQIEACTNFIIDNMNFYMKNP